MSTKAPRIATTGGRPRRTRRRLPALRMSARTEFMFWALFFGLHVALCVDEFRVFDLMLAVASGCFLLFLLVRPDRRGAQA